MKLCGKSTYYRAGFRVFKIEEMEDGLVPIALTKMIDSCYYIAKYNENDCFS